MTIDNPEQLAALRRIADIVSDVLDFMGKQLAPGITTRALDDLGREKLASYGARSAPILMYNFPGATCISINQEAAHGIPSDRIIQPGDMVNIDVSAELDGFFADMGATFLVPPIDTRKQALCHATRKALKKAISSVRAGLPLNVIGQAIESVARQSGYTPILNLGSHGTGAALHEEPLFIPSYYDKEDKRKLEDGMVITIEPFLSTGAWQVQQSDDGWTLLTPAPFLTAQYEHTLVVTKTGAMVLTRLPEAA